MSSDVATKSLVAGNLDGYAPAPIGHYSHYVELPNGLIFLSGQKSWSLETGELIGDTVAEQTDIIFDHLEGLLRGLGLGLGNLCRISCHLAAVEDYDAFNRAYTARLGPHKPARTVLAGYRLRGGALVELVAEACRT